MDDGRSCLEPSEIRTCAESFEDGFRCIELELRCLLVAVTCQMFDVDVALVDSVKKN